MPNCVKVLSSSGLEISIGENLGPFTKFYEVRRQNPGAHIVTVDDDVIYADDMLAQLIDGHRANPNAVITHRSRLASFTDMGPTPYESWPLTYKGDLESDMLIPMGVGGAFYPAGSIPDEALDISRFRRLSPKNDDIWLFWMVRRAGFTNRLVSAPKEPQTWRGSQGVALWLNTNLGASAKNDVFIQAMWGEFGLPVRQ